MLIESSQLIFELQFLKLPLPVFHAYEVITLKISTVKVSVTRNLVGSCRSLSWISLAEREY